MKTIITRLKPQYSLPFASLLAVDTLVFGATNPRTGSSILLIVGFLLVTITSYYLIRGLLALPAIYGLPIRHKQRLLRTLTALIGALLALQSIGQLELRDVLVLSLLSLLLYLYTSYAKSLRQNLQAKQP